MRTRGKDSGVYPSGRACEPSPEDAIKALSSAHEDLHARAPLALFCLLASLAHAAPNSILHRPYDLDTGHGVLRGSLLPPRSAVPPPVVLLVAGSGPTDRDGNNPFGGNNRYLLRLAEALAERGIASVRYDKRGVARSLAAAPREEDLSVGVMSTTWSPGASGWPATRASPG